MLNLVYDSIFLLRELCMHCLFRQNTYLQNKKHMLTCQGGDWLL